MKKILLIGPFPNPITGVSLANKVLKKGLINKGFKIGYINTEKQQSINERTGLFSFKKLSFITVYFQIYKIPFYKITYITIGQTFFGVVKYLPFLMFSKLLGKKTIVHLHGGFLKNEYLEQKRFKKIIMYKTLKMFDYGIVLSESLKNHLSFFLDESKIFVCSNFFENDLILSKKNVIKQGTVNLVFLSNLIEGKGINILLESLSKINSNKIAVKVAGHIPEENQKVKDLLVHTPNTKYLGVVRGKTKAELLNWGNVFCLPTFYFKGEGQPISIIEAMAFGHLIVTTNHGGIPDICSERNAIFVEKNNLEDLTNKLSLLINNSELIKEKGEFNKIYAIENFSEETFIKNMINIFDTCNN